jgi:serine protease Do
MGQPVNIRRYWAALIIALTLSIGVLIGTVISNGVRAARELPFAPGAKPLGDPSPVKLSNSFAKIAAEVSPAVVNIETTSTLELGSGSGPSSGILKHFLFGPGGARSPMKSESLGSGVILDSAGYVLTNYHVIVQDDQQPVDSIQVFLRNQDPRSGHGYEARIIGYDALTDLAVLKIDAHQPLPTAGLGDSKSMQVGDWVLAIGSPFGLRTTVTAGIISAKGREIETDTRDEFKRFIQTDAAINPGNSGGPLVNLAGQVIGINTAIATRHDSYDGVGFAVPSDTVRRVYNDIVMHGAVQRGAIGVNFNEDQNPALVRTFGARYGVVVQAVQSGAPADQAGLKMGDVITEIGSKPIHSGNELLDLISNTAPGTRVQVRYLRDGKQETASVRVGDWYKIAGNVGMWPAVQQRTPKAASQAGGILGATVTNLPSDVEQGVYKQLHLSQPQGVMVETVTPGGFADGLQVQKDDIILSINHIPLHSVSDFNRVESQLKSGEDVLLLVATRSALGYTSTFVADQLP